MKATKHSPRFRHLMMLTIVITVLGPNQATSMDKERFMFLNPTELPGGYGKKLAVANTSKADCKITVASTDREGDMVIVADNVIIEESR